MRLRDIAARLAVTERSAFGIITDLVEAGYVVKEKNGRRNRYHIQAGLDRFALFVADWQPGDVQMLTALLDKLRNSIAAVAAQEQQLRPARRRWAGTSRRDQPG